MRKFERVLCIALCGCTLLLGLNVNKLRDDIKRLTKERTMIAEYNNQLNRELSISDNNVKRLQDENTSLENTVKKLSNELTELKKKERQVSNVASRGTTSGKIVTMNVSAYTLAKEECGKSPDHPLYGITASGKRAKEWYTIATGDKIPFGTRIYIPYFKDYPNKGIFVTQDRGGAITNKHIDIYMKNKSDANQFGRRNLEVHILDNPANI